MLEPIVRNNLHRLHGVYDRVPSAARHLLTSARGLLLAKIRYSGTALNALQRLRKQERWSATEIHRLQLARLQETLDHARGTTAHYRNYPRISLRSSDDLRRLPILSREVVRRDPTQFFFGLRSRARTNARRYHRHNRRKPDCGVQ